MTIRIGGAFPFTSADANRGSGRFTLVPGQSFYPPAGNYVARLGSQTSAQWFDPIAGLWREVGQPDTFVILNTDGYNWRLINLSSTVVGTAITNAGSGATNGIGTAATGVTVTIGGPGVTGQQTALAYPVVGGSVPAPTIVQAGSGFVVPPLIVCDPPPFGGAPASFVCTLNASGGLATVTASSGGAGYVSIPNFYVIPQTAYYQGSPSGGVAAAPNIPPGLVYPTMVPPGAAPGSSGGPGLSASVASNGALLAGNALTGSGTLTAIVLYSYGSGYTGTTIPSISIAGCGVAAATALMSLCMTGISGLVAGAGYGTGTPPDFITSLGVASAGSLGGNFIPRAAAGTTTLAGGGVATFLIEDPGFGFQKVPNLAVLNTSAIATAIATAVPVCGGINDTSVLQPNFSV